MHICIYVYMYICIYAYMHKFNVYTFMCLFVYMHVYSICGKKRTTSRGLGKKEKLIFSELHMGEGLAGGINLIITCLGFGFRV